MVYIRKGKVGGFWYKLQHSSGDLAKPLMAVRNKSTGVTEKGAAKTYLVVHRSHQIVQKIKCLVMNKILDTAKHSDQGKHF